MTALLVALAGGLGAASRLVTDGVISSRTRSHWPIGTIAINIVGSFALGLLVATSTDLETLAVAGVGFLGGFTTFSTISFEVAQRALAGRRGLAAAIASVTLVGSLAAATLGVWLGSR